MFKLTANLNDDLRAFLNERRAAHGFATDDEFIEFVLRSEMLRLNRDRVDELIAEGISSGDASPMTAEDWRSLREQVESKKPGMKSAS